MPEAIATCVPRELDGADWASVEPILSELQARPILTAAEYEQWLTDRSEVEAACDEARANLFIASSCDTESDTRAAAFASFIDTIAPRLETAGFALDQRQVQLAEQFRLDPVRYAVLDRTKRMRVELFRPENVPIETELAKLGQQYGKVAGAQTVMFEGVEQTMPQMAGYQLDPDRSRREAAWRAVAARRLVDRETLNSLFDQMIHRRAQIARNAGCESFVEYTFKDKLRFDYTPQDCHGFWSGVEKHVVPFIRRLADRRRTAMGVDRLRPWDLAADPRGRPGLRPFDGGRELFDRTARVFDALDGRLARLFRTLAPVPTAPTDSSGGDKALVSECLDLDSRRGKRPGGYQYNRARSRRPFIFMNAANLHRDAMTMVHEAGHAFHSMLCAGDPLVDYRSSPIEFAEVASMSMEHMTMPHWGAPGAYYRASEDLRRAQAEHLERSVSILAWIASIDSFQHWIYNHPDHTNPQRDEQWLAIDRRFGDPVSWEGLQTEQRTQWQRQGHLFTHPMYYIEYGIAQLGALQLWLGSRERGEKAAVDAYIRALSLGGSRPLPELFAAADLKFDLGEATIGRVVEAVDAEIGRIGE